MEVGILEKSSRVRMARVSLDMPDGLLSFSLEGSTHLHGRLLACGWMKVEEMLKSSGSSCALLLPRRPSLRSGSARNLVCFPAAALVENFCFRRAFETAIKCPCGWFWSFGWKRKRAVHRDDETRHERQPLPQAHRPTCALFPEACEFLPPFEARLASRFCCRYRSVCIVRTRRLIRDGRPRSPCMRDGPEKVAVGATPKCLVFGSAYLPATHDQSRGGSPFARIARLIWQCKCLAGTKWTNRGSESVGAAAPTVSPLPIALLGSSVGAEAPT